MKLHSSRGMTSIRETRMIPIAVAVLALMTSPERFFTARSLAHRPTKNRKGQR